MNGISVSPLQGGQDSIKSCIERVYTASEFLEPLEDIIQKTIRRDLSLPCGIFLEENIIGFFSIDFSTPCDWFPKNGTSCFWLESFMIADNFQKKGYGKSALNEITCFLKKEYPGLSALNLTVNFRNKAAQTLYLKCGFFDTKAVYQEGPAGPQHIFTKKL